MNWNYIVSRLAILFPMFANAGPYLAFILILFGIKVHLIATYGNIVPFWDQWDAEGLNLYAPFLQGRLSWSDFFVAHNEHRIVTTRLFGLFLLQAAGEWNPLLQMTVNALLHVCVLVVLIIFVHSLIRPALRPVLFVFTVLLFGVPYAYENTLTGFQAQFYFVILFSILCLRLITVEVAWSRFWWLGVGCAVLAFFSFVSGLLACAAVIATGLVQLVSGVVRQKRQHVLGLLVLTGLFIAGYRLTPQVEGHSGFKAASWDQFFEALVGILSWPAEGEIGVAILMLLPMIVFVIVLLWQRPPLADRRWFLMALVFWGLGQAVSIAYGRAESKLAPRYLDLYAIFVLTSFICQLVLLRICLQNKIILSAFFISIWLFVVVDGLIVAMKNVSYELNNRYDENEIYVKNMRSYLDGDGWIYPLQPYPDVTRLESILTVEEVRQILPSSLVRSLYPDEDKLRPNAKMLYRMGFKKLGRLFRNDIKIIGMGFFIVLLLMLQAGLGGVSHTCSRKNMDKTEI